MNCLQAVNESRIRLAVYRAVDAALEDYSKTVEDVSRDCLNIFLFEYLFVRLFVAFKYLLV